MPTGWIAPTDAKRGELGLRLKGRPSYRSSWRSARSRLLAVWWGPSREPSFYARSQHFTRTLSWRLCRRNQPGPRGFVDRWQPPYSVRRWIVCRASRTASIHRQPGRAAIAQGQRAGRPCAWGSSLALMTADTPRTFVSLGWQQGDRSTVAKLANQTTSPHDL